ncbi:CLCA_X family protein [uncultured Paraglaciecola sp.]|uniref:CLCA_X family protein n=1 Tax=uncultured Paraglaciecola sp. TaxID=1765024 RepID=UPI0026110029|nr:CLCA_X family protein [uncultured Paraglaciecola sp.]
MPLPTSRLHKPYYRNGQSHRDGADVSFRDIVKFFGFRAVTIGKWVTPTEQQIAANLFFDALCDLMDILQIPETVISLNGSLSLAFGSGGKKHSNAHYDAQTKRLALAKNAGGGALAHEWFHGFDHYICHKLFVHVSAGQFASECWLQDHGQRPHRLNEKLSQCFETIFLGMDKSQPNEYVKRSAQADKILKTFYYAQPQELAARAFEACIQDNPIKNAFLVQGTKQSPEAKMGIYPTEELRAIISKNILDYFFHLGQAIDS